MIDVIYIAASARDARFTRICVASIRHYYPDVKISLLIGGTLQKGMREELARYWNVGVSPIPPGEYGWGFVKLEPLFLPAGHRFLIIDSDTAIAGPVLDWAKTHDEDFIIDYEEATEAQVNRVYFERAVAEQEGKPIPAPDFVFNSGQVFERSGLITREDFDGLVTWGEPPTLANPRVFRNGDQGVLNLVLNAKVRAGAASVARVALMRWPGHGLQGIALSDIKRHAGPPLVIHWAGMKKSRLADMVGPEILTFYEKLYYSRLPGGEARRHLAALGHWISHWQHEARVRLRLRMKAFKAK
jgi:hypothetical protein